MAALISRRVERVGPSRKFKGVYRQRKLSRQALMAKPPMRRILLEAVLDEMKKNQVQRILKS